MYPMASLRRIADDLIMVPRGGLPHTNEIKALPSGGTLILSTGSLGFLRQVSHRTEPAKQFNTEDVAPSFG
jgi:hypothetical protein